MCLCAFLVCVCAKTHERRTSMADRRSARAECCPILFTRGTTTMQAPRIIWGGFVCRIVCVCVCRIALCVDADDAGSWIVCIGWGWFGTNARFRYSSSLIEMVEIRLSCSTCSTEPHGNCEKPLDNNVNCVCVSVEKFAYIWFVGRQGTPAMVAVCEIACPSAAFARHIQLCRSVCVCCVFVCVRVCEPRVQVHRTVAIR